MADSFINVGNGKLMQTYEGNVSGNTVDAEAVVLVDSNLAPLGTTNGALNVYLGVITANAGTNLNTSALALTAAQTNGGQKTQIVDPANASNAAGVTAGALNVYLPTIQANAGTNLNTAALTAAATNGGQKTQIVDGAGNVIGSNSNALNVYLSAITANAGTNLNTANVSVKMFTGAPSLASGQVSATNVASTLVAARALRRSVTCRNLDGTNNGYIGPAPIGTTNGMLLQSLESISVDFTGLIQVITSSGNANFAYLETYD